MKFKTADLIARIDESVKRITDETTLANTKDKASLEKARQKWLKETMPYFVVFADKIKARKRQGMPVIKDDCPEQIRSGYSALDYWSPRTLTANEPRINGLKALRATLIASTDDTVTTTGLRELGFRDINSLFGGTR